MSAISKELGGIFKKCISWGANILVLLVIVNVLAVMLFEMFGVRGLPIDAVRSWQLMGALAATVFVIKGFAA